MVVIYKITSPSNKVYIGQSRNWVSRKSKYKKLKNFQQIKIHNSLLKYGYDSHKIEIICNLPDDISQDVLNNYEILYWQLYKDCGVEMLNIKTPGSYGKLSEETKIKMSNSHKGDKNSMYGKKGEEHPAYGLPGYWKNKKKENHPRFGSCGEKNPNFGRVGDKHPMFGKVRGNSPFAKKVINIITGEVYPSAKDASIILKINYSSLKSRLRKDNSKTFYLRYL